MAWLKVTERSGGCVTGYTWYGKDEVSCTIYEVYAFGQRIATVEEWD